MFRYDLRLKWRSVGLCGRMKLKQVFILFAVIVPLIGGSAAAQAQLSDSDAHTYTAAFAAAKRGAWPEAFHLAAGAHDQLLAAVLHWLRYKQQGSGESFADIAAFVNAHPTWPAQNLLRQRAEEAIATATDAQLAPWFAAHPPVLPAARLREADMWMAAGRKDDAIRLIRETWVDGDFTAVEEEQMLQRYRGILRGKDNARRIDRLIWDGRYTEAKRMLRHVGPETAALDQARIGLAEMSPGVEYLIERVPARLQNDPGLLYERARWRHRKGLDDDAAAMLERAPADPAHAGAWAKERLMVARDLLNEGEAQAAYRLADRNGLGSGPTFAELEFLAGWIALRELHRPETAYAHFVHLYDAVKLPISVARGAYWAGRAAAAMGKKAVADSWYEKAAPQITTYYGQLAAQRLHWQLALPTGSTPKPTAAETAAFDRNQLVRIAEDLAQIHDHDDMGPFLWRIVYDARTPADFVLAANLARAVRRPDFEVIAAKLASYHGVTLLSEGYPIAKLPPGGTAETPLVLAMTRQESAFDRDAVSGAGALGMMQLMPATASRVAKLLHLPFSRSRLTHDIGYNITLGRAYLNSLIGSFSGSYVLAIAAYNAGPSRVAQWIHENGDPRNPKVNVIDWIERIPIAETRNYVQRVLENLQVYRMRLGMQMPSLSLASDLKR